MNDRTVTGDHTEDIVLVKSKWDHASRQETPVNGSCVTVTRRTRSELPNELVNTLIFG